MRRSSPAPSSIWRAPTRCSFDEARVRVPVWEAGVTAEEDLRQIIMSSEEGFTLEEQIRPVQGGVLEITLPAISAILLTAAPK